MLEQASLFDELSGLTEPFATAGEGLAGAGQPAEATGLSDAVPVAVATTPQAERVGVEVGSPVGSTRGDQARRDVDGVGTSIGGGGSDALLRP